MGSFEQKSHFEDAKGWGRGDGAKAAGISLEMYNEDYVTFPRDDIAKISGLTMPVNKRNRRKHADHSEIARAIRDIGTRQRGKKIGEKETGGQLAVLRPEQGARVASAAPREPQGRLPSGIRALTLGQFRNGGAVRYNCK